MKNPKIIRTDADGFTNSDEPTLIVLEISRKEIESMNTPSAVERLHIMTDSIQNVLRYRESIVFKVNGYGADPRELPEIPEVRKYFAALCKEWPHWFWFLFRGTGSVALLLTILCKVKLHRSPDGKSYGTEFIDENELMRVIEDLFTRGNALFNAFDIDEELIKDSACSAMREIQP